MGIKYDEYLEENPFFQEIQEQHKEILEKSGKENWIICIPRLGTIQRSNITKEDIYQHILRENGDNNQTRYITLNNKDITKTNDILTIKNDLNCYNSIQILFEETFYVENYKYKLWCIECPLTQAFIINDPSDLTNIISIRDCIHLLCVETNGREVLEEISKVVDKFVVEFVELHRMTLNVILAIANSLYEECRQLTLKNGDLSKKVESNKFLLQKINLSVETYMQNCLHGHIFHAICANTHEDDARLNKTIRNLQELQLKHFMINASFYESIPLAKFELSKINNFYTVLSKLNCLKQTFSILSQRENTVALSATDLLQIFLFLIIKVNVNNWLGNLKYLTQFSLSGFNTSDEGEFLVSTLEAAIEYVKSGDLEKDLLPKSEHFYMEFELVGDNKTCSNVLQSVFNEIHKGNLEELQKLLVQKKQEKVKKKKKCHPLCSCDDCEHMNMQERTCTVRTLDARGRSPLHIACMYGTPEIVEFLINQGMC